jgi:hypothetical protein
MDRTPSEVIATYPEVDAMREPRARGFARYGIPLAAVACIGIILALRAVRTSQPDPAVRVLPPAAVGGKVRPPEPEPARAPAPGAVAPQTPITIEAPPRAAESHPAAPSNPEPSLHAAERAREHSAKRTHAHGHNEAPPIAEAEVPEPPPTRAPDAPPPQPEPAELSNAHAPSTPAPSPAPSAKTFEPPPTAAVIPRETRTERQPPARELPLSAETQIAGIEVRGSLPNAVVRRAIERLRGQFAACYDQAAQGAGHNGFGESIVELTIDERGRARNVRAHGGALAHLDACVIEVASKLICEKSPDTGTVTASFRVNFRP